MLSAIVAYVGIKWDCGPILLFWFINMFLDATMSKVVLK